MRGDCQVEKILIKNVRSLKNTGKVSLPKVTILVGENSSGKSTFLRIFPLLKQSISKRTDGPILWAGDSDDYVDFGSFTETVTNDGSDTMEFSFEFPFTYIAETRYYATAQFSKDFSRKHNVTYNFTISNHDGKDFVSKLNICLDGSVFDFDFKPGKKSSIVTVDGIRIQNVATKETIYSHLPYRGGDLGSIFEFSLPDIWGQRCYLASVVADTLNNPAESIQRKDMSYDLADSIVLDEGLFMIGEYLCHGFSLDKIYSFISKKNTSSKMRPSTVALANMTTAILQQLLQQETAKQQYDCAVLKLFHFYACFGQIERYLNSYFRQVHYIAPLRATAERYYRLRNLAIDEVDYQGKNLSVFLNGLPKERLDSFQQWTQEYFGFKVVVQKDGGHLSVKVALGEDGNSINLSDTGFGYSQILPIITQLWDLSTRKKAKTSSPIPLIIAIEQPELHLHPAVQARLASAFIASIKLAEKNGYHLQLLLETHSQTIVNQFGLAVAKGDLETNDVSVVLFEKSLGNSETTVRISGYDSFGYLQDWPIGFFAPGV